MTLTTIKKIFENNQTSKENTYLVPVISFDNFIKDELTFVKKINNDTCDIWRSLDGKMYTLSSEQIKKFKCVGACNHC